MPEQPKLIYWDADVFLSYINGITDRLPHLDVFLEQSGKEIQLFTSTITIVEVAFGKIEQDGKALDEDVENRINKLWIPKSPIQLIEFFPKIADVAKGLIRYSITEGWSLKPKDAIHLSTAKFQECEEFHTYDRKLNKYSTHLGIEIKNPVSDTPRLPLL